MNAQCLTGDWQFRQVGTADWRPATVPGCVHTDLLALGQTPDPFVADNELDVQWIAESDWEYRLTFVLDEDLLSESHIELVCEGLDTLADVTLNGKPVGHAENMFRQYRWAVKDLIHAEGEKNELLIRFQSPVAYVAPRQEKRPLRNVSQAIPGGSYLRKAPSQFGWDWGPQLPPIGIWRDIYLAGATTARFADVRIEQEHEALSDTNAQRVRVVAQVTLDRWGEPPIQALMRLTGPDGSVQETMQALDANAVSATLDIEVDDPQLWWPNSLGAQPLYDLDVVLRTGEDILDHKAFQIGLRTIELRQAPDEWGTSFQFVVNRVPIFAKGANWIPADSFPTRLDDERLEHLIRSAALVHMNMLRVWGGGFYEEERFYDLCDRYGILVWQDFAFSCSTYPTDEAFFENVRLEAVQNIRRLRHRASLALWCGNNEMEWGWDDWGWDTSENWDLKAAYDRMFHHLLPEVCAAEDPGRDYWPSSPSSNIPFTDPNSVLTGDTHDWEVWHGMLPFEGYYEHPSRFVSEFGFQSLPAMDTVRSYAEEQDWNLTSHIMEHHQRNAAGNGKIITYMSDHFRMPKDFQSLVYLSQLLQAEAVRTGVEHWRRHRDRTAGALYWQLNDCWPVASWSSVDYFGRWKALHYVARRFFAPILLSAQRDGDAVDLHLTNDRTEPWSGVVRWSLETLAGDVLEAGEVEAAVAPLSSQRLCDVDCASHIDLDNRRRVVFVYELWSVDERERLSLGVVPFVPTKHLELSDPGIAWDVTPASDTAGGVIIRLSSQQLARFLRLSLEGYDLVFSDNYIDLPAGRNVAVELPPMGLSAAEVKRALRVDSLVDTF